MKSINLLNSKGKRIINSYNETRIDQCPIVVVVVVVVPLLLLFAKCVAAFVSVWCVRDAQCDQIGLFLKCLVSIFLSTNIRCLFNGYFEKCH